MAHEPTGDFEWNDIYKGDASDYEPPDALLLELIDQLEPGRALDVGCGAGGLVVALAERGWQVTGIDVAPRAIAAAEKVVRARGFDAELAVADAAAWTPSGTFDLVTNSFALPDGHAGQAALYAMVRDALAPGGTVLIKDFDASMKRHKVFSRFHCPTVAELTAAFAGFEIRRAEVVDTAAHGHGDGNGTWTAALLHARKPR